jgi:transcriptional regulator with XRE-family HTH domain
LRGFRRRRTGEPRGRIRPAPSDVGRLERGGSAPGIDLAQRLAKALGVKVAELLPEQEDPQTVEVMKEQARALFDQLMKKGDLDTLALLNPLMARLVEDLPGGD